jgi:hypothetical protein
MSVAELMAEPDTSSSSGLPWHWLIFLPVLVSVIAGLTTLGIAIRYGDRPLPEAVTRTGPVQYGENQGLDKARALQISGHARIDPAAHGIVLELTGADLPPQLQLRLWHPTNADQDRVLTLSRGDDGSYRGVWPDGTQGLLLLLSAPDRGWEMPGAVDTAVNTLRFAP